MSVKGVECTRLWKSSQLIITVKHAELTIEKFLLALDLTLSSAFNRKLSGNFVSH